MEFKLMLRLLIGLIIIFLFIILLLLLSYPYYESKAQDESSFDKYKNTNLSYSWEFLDQQSKAHNSTYFVVDSNARRCLSSKRIAFKHEEGHIYAMKYLNRTTGFRNLCYELYENDSCYMENVRVTSELLYLNGVWEGVPEYYSLEYFGNSTDVIAYKSWVWTCKYFPTICEHFCGPNLDQLKVYRFGYKFVKYLIESGTYKDIDSVLLGIGSEEQYLEFIEFMEGT